jgi:RHS repeat-associated protein
MGTWPDPPYNRLTHVGNDDPALAQTHFFDANGNLIRENTSRHFEWDHSDQMKAFRTQVAGAEPSVHAHYLYDPGGQRVKKLVRKQGGAGFESMTYIDGLFELHRWKQGAALPEENNRLHLMDSEERVAMIRVGSPHPEDKGPNVQYHLGDHLGSSNLVVDEQAHFINREECTPYGETSFGSFARKGYRFTGKERDEESGLYYHGARYYAPWLARWGSCDPSAFSDSLNPYLYALDNPLRRIDPHGAQSQDESNPVVSTDDVCHCRHHTPEERVKRTPQGIRENLESPEVNLLEMVEPLKTPQPQSDAALPPKRIDTSQPIAFSNIARVHGRDSEKHRDALAAQDKYFREKGKSEYILLEYLEQNYGRPQVHNGKYTLGPATDIRNFPRKEDFNRLKSAFEEITGKSLSPVRGPLGKILGAGVTVLELGSDIHKNNKAASFRREDIKSMRWIKLRLLAKKSLPLLEEIYPASPDRDQLTINVVENYLEYEENRRAYLNYIDIEQDLKDEKAGFSGCRPSRIGPP